MPASFRATTALFATLLMLVAPRALSAPDPALCLDETRDTPIDVRLAACEVAAGNGNARAQAALGGVYLLGLGVPPDSARAAHWLGKAQASGDVMAGGLLGVLLENGDGVAKDPQRAFALYRAAAEAGHREAQFNLARAYQFGIGTSVDNVKSTQQYLKSALAGYPAAKVNLAQAYRKGRGVPVDEVEAFKWFESAAKDGVALAQENWGLWLYNHGRVDEAVVWLQKAADQGDARAAGALETIRAQQR